MATLPELKLLLYRIQKELPEQPVFVRGTGVPVDDPAHDREIAELDRLSLRLSLILRELKNKSNLLSARQKGLWNIAPADRYRAASSIKTQQGEINDILRLANEIQALLEDLIRRNSSISEGDISQGIGELIEKLYHQAHTHGETQHMPDGLSYTPASKGEHAGSVEGVAIFVFVALRAWIALMKRGKK